MEQSERQRIVDGLRKYVARYPSQNKAAASLKGVSAATVSAILNGNHDLISEEMWRNVANQTSRAISPRDWAIIGTRVFNEVQAALADAQENGIFRWIVGRAGRGKTTAANYYAAEHKNVFVLLCSRRMTTRILLRELARKVGVRTTSMVEYDMVEAIADGLMQLDSPLLIFDEADKLTDKPFSLFLDLYNRIEFYCGIAAMSPDVIEHRISKNIGKKEGYDEIESRMGRRYFELAKIAPVEIASICMANGIKDDKDIAEIVDLANETHCDLRAVRAEIRRRKAMAAARRTSSQKQSNNS